MPAPPPPLLVGVLLLRSSGKAPRCEEIGFAAIAAVAVECAGDVAGRPVVVVVVVVLAVVVKSAGGDERDVAVCGD